MQYLVIIEKTDRNYSAYLPDLPGCISTGSNQEEVIKNLKEALSLHLEGLKEDGLPIPEPLAESTYVTAAY